MTVTNVFDIDNQDELERMSTTASSTMMSASEPRGSSEFSSGANNKIPLNLESVSLVGRSVEMKQLVDAYDRVRKKGAAAEVVLIRGESGTGKSVLVENLERTERKGREFFVTGKFQQYGQTRPYGGFVDATAELSFAVEESESLNQIRKVILDTLSSDEINLLISVMPTIGFMVPAYEKEDVVPNEQTFNRFMGVYRKFLTCVCSEETPLVFFLDDLQWVDDVSRQLIHSITKDSILQNLLLIGTIRQDPSISGVFDLTSEAVLESSEIVLGTLSEEDVNLIVSKATERPPEETDDLAEVVHRKTGGNAYYVIQYLEMLHRDDLLVFSFRKSRWKWDAEKISSHTDVSENVVHILIRKIESLAVDVQVALIVAACLGYSFKVNVVEFILGLDDFFDAIPSFLKDKNLQFPMSNIATQIALTQAVQAGLIDKVARNKCKFSHDRVQQSAHQMLRYGEERQRLQKALGKILLELSRQEEAEDWMLFAAVDLLSTGNGSKEPSDDSSHHFKSEELGEIDALFPQVCLEAAQKAAQKAAFRSAAKYADEGISRLFTRGTSDQDTYDLWLDLTNLSAEMHYSRGDFSASSRVVDKILEGARSVDDCFRAYNVCMNTFIAREDWASAVSFGSRIVRDLGVPTPKKPTTFTVLSLLAKCKWMMKGKTPSDLEQLPPMENPRNAEALFLLGCTAFSSFCKGEETRCTVLCLKMFLLTLEFGICADSAYAFAAFGMVMSHVGEYALAYKYGWLAAKTLERPGMEKSIAKVLVVVHNHLNFLKRPIQDSLGPLLYGYESGMRYGDVVQAAFCLRSRACMGVFAGMHLGDHERELLSFCDFYREFKQESSMKLQAPWLQLTQNLLGRTQDVLKLTGDAMDESSLSEEKKEFTYFDTHYAKRALLYTFGEFEMADNDRKQSDRLGRTAIIYARLWDYVVCCLTCLAMARKGKRVRYYKQQAALYKRELATRAKQGAVNCVPLLSLISAEERALKDKTGDSTLYKEAVTMLGRCGFRLFKGIACERAGEYLLECDNKEMAQEFIQQAWNEFYDYGAYSKHTQMREKYKGVIAFSERPRVSYSRSSYRLSAHSLKKWQQDV